MRHSISYYRIFRSVCSHTLLLFVCWCPGCSPEMDTVPPEVRTVVDASSTFLLLSQLGVPPFFQDAHSDLRRASIHDAQQIVEAFNTHLRRVPLDEYVEIAETVRLAIVQRRDGKAQAVLGIVASDGDRYFQLVGLSLRPRLVTRATLDKLSGGHVWLPEAEPGRGVRVEVGDATVSVDKLWHNFGMTTPFSKSNAAFRLSNEGSSPYRIQSVSTDCGCVVADVEKGKVLFPGDEEQLSARISTTDNTGFTHRIALRIVDQTTEADRLVTLALFGNQLPSMSVTPGAVDFGTLRNEDSPIGRSVRLAQTIHDRFQVTEVTSRELPITATIQPEKAGSQGLDQDSYRIALTLDPSTLSPGVHQSIVEITTTSRFRRTVEVPVACRLRFHVEAIPSVAAFGLVAANAVKEQRIQLVSTDRSAFSATVLSSPENCQGTIESKGDSVVLVVKPQFRDAGAYRRKFSVHVSSEAWTENLDVECVAYVKP